MRRFAGLLAALGELRADLTVERAADVLWTLCAQATHDSLVVARGWSAPEYRVRLGDTLAAALLA